MGDRGRPRRSSARARSLADLVVALVVGVVLLGPASPAAAGDTAPTLRDTLSQVGFDGRIAGSPTRIDGTRPPEDYRTGAAASGLAGAADTRFAELAFFATGRASTLLDRIGFAGCDGRRGPLTYVCPSGDAPDPRTLGNDVLAVHLALNGNLTSALTPGTTLGFALLTQNAGAPQAPFSGSLTGASDAYRTVFSTSGTTVTPLYQFWSFPWAVVPGAADPPFNLQILDDRGGVTWLVDPAVLRARNVTGLRPKTFINGSTIANPIPDLLASNPTVFFPYDPTTIGRLRFVTAATPGLVTPGAGGGESNLLWWLLAGGGLLATGGGLLMARRGPAEATVVAGDWNQIVAANEAAEQQIAAASTALGNRLGTFFGDTGRNVTVFARAYSRAVHGLDIIEETRKENDSKIAVAQMTDTIINLVQLYQLTRAVGGGAFRWHRGRQIAAQNRRIVSTLNRRLPEIDAMNRAGLRGQFTSSLPEGFGTGPWVRAEMPSTFPPRPEWMPTSVKLRDLFGGEQEALWHMTQLADEVGADVQTLVVRFGPERALQKLRVQVAAQRGVPMINLDDYLRLFKLDRAVQGLDAYNLEDVRWFLDARQRDPNLMTKLDEAVGEWDAATAEFLENVAPAVDPQMLKSLNQLIENQGLADAVANTPVGARGLIDVTLPDGSVARLLGDLSDAPSPVGTGAFPGVLSPPTLTGSFPHVLSPPGAGGPIIGVGPGQGIVGIPPTIAPGGRLPTGFGPDIPPTWSGTGVDVPPTWTGDAIPPTWAGTGADIPPTWAGTGADIPPTWSGGTIPPTWSGGTIPPTWSGNLADIPPTWTGGYTPPLGATVPPPVVTLAPPGAGTLGFDAGITLPPGALDATFPPGVMGADQAQDLTRTLVDEGRRVLVTGDTAPQLLSHLPGQTPVVRVTAGATPGSAPVVERGLVGQFFHDILAARRDPVHRDMKEAVGSGTDAVYLVGQGAAPIIQNGVFGDNALVDPGGLLQLGRRAGTYFVGADDVFVADYSDGGYGAIALPGIEFGMQVVCTPGGVAVFDPSMPQFASPAAVTPAGLLQGFEVGAGAPLTDLGISADPAAVDAVRADLVHQTGQLMAGRDWFRAPQDYLDELEDFGVKKRGFSFAWWGGGGESSWLGEWGWNFVMLTSNPTETLLKGLPYIGLADMMGDDVLTYTSNHADDFSSMNRTLSSMVTDLEWTAEHLGEWAAPLETALGALDQAMADASAFATANPEWAAQNPGVLAAKLARDAETRAHVVQSLASLQALASRLGPLVGWLRELRNGPNGAFKHVHTLVEPTSILRVSGAYLQLIDALAGVLLLAPPPDDAPQSEPDGRYKPSVEEITEQRRQFLDSLPPEDYHQHEVDDIPRPTPEQIREEYGTE
jgi:hypothetical protein